jgi:dihydroneopterin aldolase / 2-amino-4-hydroxy-6-hydroxymethyldihydropteridine diphosphokinase
MVSSLFSLNPEKYVFKTSTGAFATNVVKPPAIPTEFVVNTSDSSAENRQTGSHGADKHEQMDRIEIRGLRVVGIVGALDEERERAQPFEVDVDILTDISRAGDTDQLGDTLNYANPVGVIEDIIRNERHVLLERVATRIAEEILSEPQVLGVEVVVRKLHPPIPADMTSTAVRITRNRAHFERAPRPVTRAYLALGTNLGDRRAYLRRALENIDGIVAVSNLYETDPVDTPAGSGRYLNMVVAVDTDLDPFALLARCQLAEKEAGRVRGVRNAPRTLDIDVLLYGGVAIQSAELTVPHPRMWERRFVVAPLADLAPNLVPLDWEHTLPVDGVQRVDPL